MLGEAHFVFNLTDMSKRDAEEMGVEEDDLRSYLRLDDAKTKMGPPVDARWFERHGELMTRKFGVDYMANVGGAIHGHPGGTINGAKAMRQSIDGTHGSEYEQAIEKWGLVG